MHRIPVGVLGASGYAGRELCELVSAHPHLELTFAAANSRAGESARVGGREVTFVAPDDVPLGDVALVFSALPHGASAAWVERAGAAGVRAVDLSTDLRPGSGATGVPYGLPEARPALVAAGVGGDGAGAGAAPLLVGREALAGATVVANPGCYPTAILLALQPLVAAGLVQPGATVAVAAASGVTGAGMSPKPELLFGEVTENFRAYGVGNEHRHLLEMREVLAGWGADADLLFTPHLLPVARGILATITVPLAEPLDGDPAAPWRDFYAGEPFVEIADALPELREVQRRNVVRIAVRRAAGLRTPTLVVLAAIDNLTKGAAGQAVQNANLLLGLPETAGLPL